MSETVTAEMTIELPDEAECALHGNSVDVELVAEFLEELDGPSLGIEGADVDVETTIE